MMITEVMYCYVMFRGVLVCLAKKYSVMVFCFLLCWFSTCLFLFFPLFGCDISFFLFLVSVSCLSRSVKVDVLLLVLLPSVSIVVCVLVER